MIPALGYLWDLLTQQTAPRLGATITGRVRAGEDVEVAGLVVSTSGVSATSRRRSPAVVPWSDVGEPAFDGDDIVVPRREGKPLRVPAAGPNAHLLPQLLPALRALFG